jgi:succinyl-CoA synthetase beta subunit
VLVNIFGGIVRCDLIAEGIIGAVAGSGRQGSGGGASGRQQRRTGRQILADSGLNIIAARV